MRDRESVREQAVCACSRCTEIKRCLCAGCPEAHRCGRECQQLGVPQDETREGHVEKGRT